MNKIIKNIRLKALTLLSFAYLLSADISLAQPPGGGPKGLINPIKANSISDLLDGILTIIVTLGSIIVPIAIIYSGFKFVWAKGNSTALEEAKRNLWYVLIGAAIVLGAQALKILITGTVDEIKAGI